MEGKGHKQIPAIEAVELTRLFNSHLAVNHVSFKVAPGTTFGLLGPNGAGKSTTIKMLTTLLPPTLGTAKILGHDVCRHPSHVRGLFGYVPQQLSADGDLSGYENLLLSAKLYGLSHSKREKRIAELLHFMNLAEFANQLVREYSGGMIRALEIAQALLHEPSILILDEPTVGLDPVARKSVWRRIDAWRKEHKTTILLTTHDMNEADQYCNVVAFMHVGKIVAMDAPSKLKSALGAQATLDDVFINYTGTSITEGGDYAQVKQTRRTISSLD